MSTTCTTNNDCPTLTVKSKTIPYTCNSGKCVYGCTDDTTCQSVSPAFKCMSGQCVNQSCSTDGSCPEGTICGDNGFCVLDGYVIGSLTPNWTLLIIAIILLIIVIGTSVAVIYWYKKKKQNKFTTSNNN